jgi:hypothetical protein
MVNRNAFDIIPSFKTCWHNMHRCCTPDLKLQHASHVDKLNRTHQCMLMSKCRALHQTYEIFPTNQPSPTNSASTISESCRYSESAKPHKLCLGRAPLPKPDMCTCQMRRITQADLPEQHLHSPNLKHSVSSTDWHTAAAPP